MFREIRRKDRIAEKTDIERLLVNGEYGFLSTIGPEGYPYVIPLSFAYANHSIYFHCAVEGHKLDNIAFNNKVSFCVVGETRVLPEQFATEYESVVLFGKASLIEGDEKKVALEALICKYSGGFEREGMEYINKAIGKTKVVKIEIERITGKRRK